MLRDLLLAGGGVMAGVLSYIGLRFTTRSSRAANRENRDYIELGEFRWRVENHLPWDNLVAGAVRDLRGEVDELREATGKPARSWTDIPPAPSLFPKIEHHNERKAS